MVAIISNTCIAWNAYASQLKTDVLLYVPKQMVRASASEFKGIFNHDIASAILPGEFPARVETVTSNFNWQVKSLEPKDNGAADLVLTASGAKAKIGGFHIDSFVEREVNGSIIRVHLKVDCQDMVVEARRSTDLMAHVQIDQNLKMRIEQLQWPPQSKFWKVRAATCAGPTDILPALEDHFNKMWNTSSNLREYLISQINPELQSWLDDRLAWSESVSEFGSSLQMRGREFLDSSDAWIVRSDLQINTGKICPAFESIRRLQPQKIEADPRELHVTFLDEVMPIWAQCIHEMSGFRRLDYARDIPQFVDLMASPSAKDAVWPDLNRFSERTQFALYSSTAGAFSMQPRSMGQGQKGSRSIYYSLSTNALSRIRLSSTQRERPYVSFFSPIRGNVELKINPGTFSVPGQLLIQWSGQPQVKLRHQFDVRVSNDFIDTRQLDPELQKAMKAKVFKKLLRPLRLTSSRQVQVNGIKRTEKLISLPLVLTK